MKQQLFFITLSWCTIAGAVKPDDIFDAAKDNDTELAQQCIDEYGVEILEKKNYNKDTPLQHAAYWNSKEIVQLMLKEGGLKLLKTKNNYGDIPLHQAATKNAKETAQLMLEKGDLELLEAKNDNGDTPLHKAAFWDSKETAQLLLKEGGLKLLKMKNNDGFIPLHNAATADATRTIKFLLSKGANIQAIDSGGKKPIDLIWLDEIKQLFTQRQLKLNQQLLSGTQENNLESVVQTLNGGAQINTQDENSRTSLHHATLQGNLTFIKGLLGRNADPTIYDNKGYGELAVHIAAGEPERLIPFIEAAFGQRLCIEEKQT